jgi:hypothetical protein
MAARVEREKSTVAAMLKKWPQYIRPNPRRKGPFPEISLIRQPMKGDEPRKRELGSKRKTRKVKKEAK